MSDWTTDKAVEAVTELIELTQAGEMVWEPSTVSPARLGELTTPPYYAKYKGQLWRIQGEVRKGSDLARLWAFGAPIRQRVDLELVDKRGLALPSVPDVPNKVALLDTVQSSSTSVDDVLDKLLDS